jgi:hypothetical protein
MEPLPYGTTGAEFQEIVALGNRGLPVIVPKLLGLYTLPPARRQGVGLDDVRCSPSRYLAPDRFSAYPL